MRYTFTPSTPFRGARSACLAIVLTGAFAALASAAQSILEAPANAPATGRIAPDGEPGAPLSVSGIVVRPDGTPVANASLYIYQTDHEGYYGVKPASVHRNPRLKLYLRTDARGACRTDRRSTDCTDRRSSDCTDRRSSDCTDVTSDY